MILFDSERNYSFPIFYEEKNEIQKLCKKNPQVFTRGISNKNGVSLAKICLDETLLKKLLLISTENH